MLSASQVQRDLTFFAEGIGEANVFHSRTDGHESVRRQGRVKVFRERKRSMFLLRYRWTIHSRGRFQFTSVEGKLSCGGSASDNLTHPKPALPTASPRLPCLFLGGWGEQGASTGSCSGLAEGAQEKQKFLDPYPLSY